MIEDVKGRAGIQRQITLPLTQSLRMTKNSIFIRMGRSVITAAGIFLGIAFMCSILAGTAVKAGLPEAPGSVIVEAGSAKDIWLVVIALVVATIGIVNSMLMAVTERYKEIGTMKCLGALDGLVVRLFLLESGLLGLLGAIAGAIAGTGFGLLMQAARNGWSALGKMGPAFALGLRIPGWLAVIGVMIAAAVGLLILRWLYTAVARRGSQGVLGAGILGAVGAAGGLVVGAIWFRGRLAEEIVRLHVALGLWVSVGLAVVLGAILAIVAAVYPAQQAAKMPPAAALRVEI